MLGWVLGWVLAQDRDPKPEPELGIGAGAEAAAGDGVGAGAEPGQSYQELKLAGESRRALRYQPGGGLWVTVGGTECCAAQSVTSLGGALPSWHDVAPGVSRCRWRPGSAPVQRRRQAQTHVGQLSAGAAAAAGLERQGAAPAGSVRRLYPTPSGARGGTTALLPTLPLFGKSGR